jgi:hypothetical protein
LGPFTTFLPFSKPLRCSASWRNGQVVRRPPRSHKGQMGGWLLDPAESRMSIKVCRNNLLSLDWKLLRGFQGYPRRLLRWKSVTGENHPSYAGGNWDRGKPFCWTCEVGWMVASQITLWVYKCFLRVGEGLIFTGWVYLANIRKSIWEGTAAWIWWYSDWGIWVALWWK